MQERRGGGASFRVFVPSEPVGDVPPAGDSLGQGALGLLPAEPPTGETLSASSPRAEREIRDVDHAGVDPVEGDHDLPHLGEIDPCEHVEREPDLL